MGNLPVRLVFGDQARLKLIEGASFLSKCTEVTLGPKVFFKEKKRLFFQGKNVAIEYELGSPKITKDGVTVAKNVYLVKRKDLRLKIEAERPN